MGPCGLYGRVGRVLFAKRALFRVEIRRLIGCSPRTWACEVTARLKRVGEVYYCVLLCSYLCLDALCVWCCLYSAEKRRESTRLSLKKGSCVRCGIEKTAVVH